MQLQLKAGADTEALLSFIANKLSDDDIDSIDIRKDFEVVEGLATEPVTIAAVITASGAIVVTIATLFAKWLEDRRQKGTIELLIKGYKESPEAGEAVLELAKLHAGVRVTADDVR